MQYVFILAVIVLAAMYIRKKVLIDMNILQVHSYESNKMLSEIKDREIHDKTELIKNLSPVIGLIPCCLANRTLASIFAGIIELILIYNLYKYTENPNTKKKLVITDRVKRMLYVVYPLIALALIIPFVLLFFFKKYIRFIMIAEIVIITLLALFEKYFIVFSNYALRGVEAKINNKFIDEAKDILKSMPDLKVIGVTGSYGKTSTKFAIATLLSERYAVCKTPESYNTTMGVVRTIREVLDKDDEIFVCEMGARHIGDIKEICDIVNPTSGVITAIGDAHLETFKGIENTKEAKFELARSLKDNELLYVNVDNENIVSKLGSDVDKNLNNYKVITYSLKDKDADYYATNIEYTEKGSKFDVIVDGNEKNKFNVEIKLLGKHNIYNTLCAIAVAKENKLTNDEIIRGCNKLKQVEHRLQILKDTNQITVIDDTFNANPEGTKNALEVLKRIKGNKKIIITPGMTEGGDKEYELNKEFGMGCIKNCDYTIMVGERQTKPMQDAFKEEKVGTNKYYVAKNLDDASNHLKEILELGDVVLYENDMPEDK